MIVTDHQRCEWTTKMQIFKGNFQNLVTCLLVLSSRESLTQKDDIGESEEEKVAGGQILRGGFLWENLRSYLLPPLQSSERGLKETDHCRNLMWPLPPLAGPGKLSSLGRQKRIWA